LKPTGHSASGEATSADGNRSARTRLTGACSERQPDPQRPGAPKLEPDGPQASASVSPPRSTPHKEFSDALPPRKPTGFAAHPELRWRPGRPKHGNYRLVPKQEGWRPYHPQSQLSVTDILAIRASPITVADLARLYGVGQGTIRDIRAGRRGRTLARQPHVIDERKSPDELAAELVTAICRITQTYRRALRRSMERQRKVAAARKEL
jgi:hypothetical protein